MRTPSSLAAASGAGEEAPLGTPSGKLDLVGRVLCDRFHIREPIARGGMGVVYRAEQLPLGRTVALKVLDVKGAQDQAFDRRFLREAKAVAGLSHPNTVTIHDYGCSPDGVCFIAMEHLEGQTLQSIIQTEGALEPTRAVHLALQVCGSLAEAHAQGLVHRDLKPSNIFVTRRGTDDDYAKVLDFGLVKAVGQQASNPEDAQLTRPGALMGSPRYMSPEQIRREAVDERSDIYALGTVLFTALAGAPPFSRASIFELMKAQVWEPPPRLETVAPDRPEMVALGPLVARCLA